MKEVSIIFPALNEEETIGKVIDEVPMEEIQGKGYRAKVIVFDNGSTDKTREIAESKGARVITEPRRGKGRAIRTAFESVGGDYIFILDAEQAYIITHTGCICTDWEMCQQEGFALYRLHRLCICSGNKHNVLGHLFISEYQRTVSLRPWSKGTPGFQPSSRLSFSLSRA